MNELEKAFKYHINTSEQYLRQIGINIKDKQGTYKSFDNVVNEVAKVFYKMDKNVANIKDALKRSKQNDITKAVIMQNMVGIRYMNKLIVMINDLIDKKYNNIQL